MYNDLFSIGPFTIHGYGLMIGLGFAAACMTGDFRARKKGLDPDLTFNLAVVTIVLGFCCAKVLYLLTVLPELLADPSRFRDLSSGFVVFGGILGGGFFSWLLCRYKKASFLAYADLCMPSIALAQAFGRIGCFLAGCCYGKVTDGPFAVTFSHSYIAPNGVPLLPTQLISGALNVIHILILLAVARRQKREGEVFAAYMIFYSFGRFAVEFLRGDLDRGFVGILSTSQFIALFTGAAGILFRLWIRKHGKAVSAEDFPAAETSEPAEASE